MVRIGGITRGVAVAAMLLLLSAPASSQPPPAPPATGGPSTGARYPIGMSGPYVSRYPDAVANIPPTLEQLSKLRVLGFDTKQGLYLDGFTVWIVDDFGMPDATLQPYLRLTGRNMENGDYHLVISLWKAPSLTNLFFYVRYHDEKFNPRQIEPGSVFGFDGDRLWFTKMNVPGVVATGMTRLRPDVTGGTKVDDGVVCEIVFEERPADLIPWWLDRAPNGRANHPANLTAYVDPETGCPTLYWRETNVGDYNNDGEVGMTDMIVIGRRYGRVSADGVEDDWDRLPDGNHDGEVNRRDQWLIEDNFGSLLSGYRIYRRPAGSLRAKEVLLSHRTYPLLPLTIHRPTDWNPIRINEYRYVDKELPRAGATTPAEWTYRIVPYNAADDVEGISSDLEITVRLSGGLLSVIGVGEGREGREGRERKDSRMR